MAATLKLRRGASTPSLVQSELFFNTTNSTLVVGDGTTNHTLVKIGTNAGNLTLTGDISASNLTLSGNATINGNITFGGSLITLGDENTDNIVITGELSSSLVPNDDNAFDIGTSSRRYKHIYAVSASIDELLVGGSGILSSSVTNFVDYSSSVDSRLDSLNSYTQSTDLRINSIETFTQSIDTRVNTLETTFSSSVDSRLDLLENFSSSQYITDSSSFDTRLDTLEITFSSSVDLRLDNLEITGSDHESRIDIIETTFSSSVDLRLDNAEWTGSDQESRIDILEASQSYFDNTFSGSVDLRLDNSEWTGSNHESRITSIEGYSSSLDSRLDDLEFTGSNHESRLDTIEGPFSSSLDSRLNTLNLYTQSNDLRVDDLEATGSDHENRLDVIEGPLSSSINQQLDSIHSYTSSLKNSIDVNGSNLTVLGNLTVQGTQTSLNTTELLVEDKLLALASGSTTSVQADGGGIFISGADASMTWNHADQLIEFNTKISSSVGFKGDGSELTDIQYGNIIFDGSGLVSGSSQIDLTGTTNYISGIKDRLNAEGVFSQSAQVNADSITNFDSNVKDKLNQDNVHSGSYLGTATTSNLDEGSNLYYQDTRVKTKLNTEAVVSSSAQISDYNTFLEINGDGVVSGSSQIDLTGTTNYISGIKERLNAETVLSGSSQVTQSLDGRYLEINGDSVISSSAQISAYNTFLEFNGDGIVSESAQINVNDTQNFTSFSSSVDSRLDSVETDQHTHSNKANLDTINQNLASSDTPTFTNLSLTTLGTLGSGELNAVFSGSAGTLGVRSLGTAAFYHVSQSIGFADDNVIGTAGAMKRYIDNQFIEVGAGDITSVGGGDGLSGGADSGSAIIHLDTSSLHFINGVNGIVSIGDGVVSSSAQISAYGVFAELNGDGLVSSSLQITNGSGILSSSVQNFDTFSGSVDSRLDTLEGETHENPLTFADTVTIDFARVGDTISANVIGGILSSSAQISGYGVFAELNGDGLVSSSQQISNYNTFLEINGDNVVSSSQQISNYNTFLEINGDSVVSSSQQISNYGVFAELNGDNLVSGSSQIDLTQTTNYVSGIKTRLNTENVISSSAQVTDGSGILSSSLQNFTQFSSSVDSRLDNQELFSQSIDTTIKSKLNTETVISGSSQVVFNNISGNPFESASVQGFQVLWIDEQMQYILPRSGSYTTLGAPGAPFKDLFLSGNTIDLGGTLISRDSLTGNIQFIDSGSGSPVSADVDFDTIVNKPTLISGSSQVNADTITNFDTNVKDKLNVEGVISGSDQLTGSLVTLDTVQTITGTKTFNDIVVNGTGSFAYITSTAGSAKIIGDSFIILNNDTPTQRYAGLSVQDSGSANTTASLQFDGQTNDWFYQYSDDGGVTTDHGVVLFGPEYSGIGNPTYPTNNTIQKGNGGHHLLDSNITDTGTLITLGSNVQVNGNISLNGTVDGVDVAQLNTDFNTLKGKTLVSGSIQVDHDQTTNFVANEHINHASVSITAGDGLTGGGTITTNRTLNVGQGTGITVSADAISTNDSQIVHDNLSGFVANEHIDHSTVTMTAGNGLTGGGTIAATRTFNVGQGDGISVTADAISVDGTVLRTTGDGVVSGSFGGDVTGTIGALTVGKVQGIALTSGEATQLANIGTTTISATQWGYVGALNQGLTQTSTVQFGKVGVGGASDATYELKVTGDIGATGDVVAYISSDRRLKDEITPIENSLQKINSIGGYSFVWNENQHIYKGKDYGVIAQEIETILPELVETRENGYKAVKYDRIVSLLIEGIKELSKEVSELKEKIGK